MRVSPLAYADLFSGSRTATAASRRALVNMTTQDAEIVRLTTAPSTTRARAARAQHRPPRAAELPVLHVRPEVVRDRRRRPPVVDLPGAVAYHRPVGGTTISRVVMVDATTGETQDLAIEDVPQWVDHAYPTDLLLEQYNWSGKYKDGWLNSVLGQRNVSRPRRNRRQLGVQLHRRTTTCGCTRAPPGHGDNPSWASC
ncbi:MAG: hypothetical protein ACLT98_07560 [Eggerthellaceae bacterium]